MSVNNPSSPVAIIGIGCLFPKADGPGAYWANVCDRVDAITAVPPSHWRPEDYVDPDPKAPDRVYVARGGFLDPVPFPPLEFGITPNALEATDTTQLLGLMVARQALADAGYAPPRDFDRGRVGVILGVTGALELVIPLGARLGHPIWRKALKEAGINGPVADEVVKKISDSYVGWQEDSFPGLLGNVAAGRIANRLDLGGTNCVVDAACASSLGAIHLAMLELTTGRADMIVSGGLDSFNDIFMYTCFSKTPALSPGGNARPFDAGADGTILGEGLGVVILKRLADARRDGDRIYAVVRAVGSSSDGKGNAVYAPSSAGQVRALRNAYSLADVTPDTIELVEAHGTGTRAGDAAELAALDEVYRASAREGTWCAIGSVKSQIGHTKAAAGVAGLIKAALALHHKVLPPTIKVTKPSELATPGLGPLYVNTEKRPWLTPADHPRRAAVSSFGFGGSNFHAVLEECSAEKAHVSWDGNVQILAFSGATRYEILTKLIRFPVGQTWEEFRTAAAQSRQAYLVADKCRLLMVVERGTPPAAAVENARAALERLRELAAWSTPERIYFGSGPAAGKLALIFPGQGSQYVGMMRDLVCHFPQALRALAEADAAGVGQVANLPDQRGPVELAGLAGRLDRQVSDLPHEFAPTHGKDPHAEREAYDTTRLSDFIYPLPAFDAAARQRREDALRATDVAQPALGAVSLAALRVLESFGVTADATAGHSYGELVALCASGRIDAPALHRISRLRGRLMTAESAGDRGGMVAVRATLEQVESLIKEEALEVVIANRNAPSQHVLSGATAAIEQAVEACGRRSLAARRLPVSAAFHSPFVAAASAPFLGGLAGIPFRAGTIPVFANATSRQYPHDPQECRELLAGQLSRPVAFVEEIGNVYQLGVRTFLEVGPGCVLTGLVGAILEGKAHQAIAVDASAGKRSGLADLAFALAQLSAAGTALRLSLWDDVPHRPLPAVDGKPTLTVPICGANYVKPRPPAAAAALAAVPPRRAPASQAGAGDVRTKENSTPAVSRAAGVAIQETKPMPASKPTATPPVPAQPSTHGESLPATQENLVALQRLGEQTAHLHRQFLEGQDRMLNVFQGLFEQQQRSFRTGSGVEPPPRTAAPPARVVDVRPVETVRPEAVRPAPVPQPRSAPAAAVPAVIPVPPRTPARLPVATNVEQLLRAVVSEKTGYPPETLELDMELDSDLGIDSIKRVEIFSALQERMPDAPPVKPEHLGTLRTLRQVAVFLGSTNGAGTSPETKVAQSAPAARPVPPAPAVNPASAAEGRNGSVPGAHVAAAKVNAILLDVVSQKTGYPAEMLDLDLELDSGLGIDSIKRVEIFSALQERMPEAPTVKPEHLGTLRTLRQVAAFLGTAGPEVAANVATSPATANQIPASAPATSPPASIHRGGDSTASGSAVLDVERTRWEQRVREQLEEIEQARAVLATEQRTARQASEERRQELEREGRALLTRLHQCEEREKLLEQREVTAGESGQATDMLAQDHEYRLELLEAERDAAWTQVQQLREQLEQAQPAQAPAGNHDADALQRRMEELQRELKAADNEARMWRAGYDELRVLTESDSSVDLATLPPSGLVHTDLRGAEHQIRADEMEAERNAALEQLGNVQDRCRQLETEVDWLRSQALQAPHALVPPTPAARAEWVPVTKLDMPGPEELVKKTVAERRSALRRFVLHRMPLTRQERQSPFSFPEGGEVWITTDDAELSASLAARLDGLGLRPRQLSQEDWRGLECPARLAGLVIVAPVRGMDDAFLKASFQLLQRVGPPLRQAGQTGPAFLATVSRMDGSFGLENSSGDPLSGGLAGLAKTAGHEWPEVHCRAFDVAADFADADEAALALADELPYAAPIEVGIGPRGRCTLGLKETPLAAVAEAPLMAGDLVVLSGGARGVTAEVGVALARAFRPVLVLLGRSPEPAPEPDWLATLSEEADVKRALMEHAGEKPTPREIGALYQQVIASREVRRTVERIAATGARVIYRRADVRNAVAVATALRDLRITFGPVRGIVHGAGILADRRIEDKTEEQFERVYGTKVEGLRALLRATAGDDLRFIALFSSSTGRVGRVGQIDYAAANEVLNKFAQTESRWRPGCRVVAVNWGPWDGGMVTPAHKAVFAKERVGVIPLEAGAEYLIQEIGQPADHDVEVVVLAGDAQALTAGVVEKPRAADPGPKPAPVDPAPRPAPVDPSLDLSFERDLNVEQTPVLRSHVLDGRAVLPVALMVEWLGHAAMHGNPGLMFHGFDGLRVFKGVRLEEDETYRVRILAGKAVKQDGLFRITTEMRGQGADGQEHLHARAEILLADRPIALGDGQFRIAAATSHPQVPIRNPQLEHDPRHAYEALLFHGDDLQGIQKVTTCTAEGIAAAVATAPPPSAWIRQPLRTSWLADPLVLDCAFQMMILWTHENQGAFSLPCYLRKYRQAVRSFPRGVVQVVARVTKASAGGAQADLEFVDGSGKRIALLEGYECVIDRGLEQAFRRNRLAGATSAS